MRIRALSEQPYQKSRSWMKLVLASLGMAAIVSLGFNEPSYSDDHRVAAHDFLGTWKGRWYSNGRKGSAEWQIDMQDDGSLNLAAEIYTPNGPLEYTFAPEFDEETLVLKVNDKPSGVRGTIVVDGDELRFDYRRRGREGHYNMTRTSAPAQ